KLEAGRMDTTRVRADLAELVHGAATNFDSLAKERGITYRIDAGGSVAAEIDIDKITRVVRNLISNAFHFANHAATVRPHVREEDAHAFIEVADDGPGVPPPMRELVFERFRQLEGGATRRFGGTGLGLAIAKDFVELHGGRISIGEEPGGGALFVVELPLLA